MPAASFSLLRSQAARGERSATRSGLTPQQLTGRLKTAETSNHLLFLVEQYDSVLNEYHVRAALTRLAQSNRTTELSEIPAFQKLLSRTSELMTTFRHGRAQGGLKEGSRRAQGPPKEVQDVREKALVETCRARNLEDFEAMDVANLLWSFARRRGTASKGCPLWRW
eukprot:Skav222152  [mRNA]  locus=scaffold2756:36397:45043:- [translate_table: standard]